MGCSRQVFVFLVQGQEEVQSARLGTEVSLELLFLVQHVERAPVVNITQTVQLLHHKLLDYKLVDDALRFALLDGHVADVEVYLQVELVLQSRDVALGIYLQCPVGPGYHHVVEPHALVVAFHTHAERQWQCEVAQDRGEGT